MSVISGLVVRDGAVQLTTTDGERKGDGQMPVPGWTGEYDWTGVVPFAANPTCWIRRPE